MSYPIILYPKLIIEFCHQYPLPEVSSSCATSSPIQETQEFGQSVVLSQPPQPPVVLPVKLLWLIWLFWLYGAIALGLLTIAWGLLWWELLLVVTAYSCLIGAAYSYVFGCRQKLLSRYKQQVIEYKEQEILSKRQQEVSSCKLGRERLQTVSKSVRNDLQYRNRLLKDLMSLRVSSTGISQAQQGVSEEKFLLSLQRYFEGVLQGAEFEIPLSRRSYSADFTVIHTPSGIGIDVEIDEPYAGKSKKPTHCCDVDRDLRRNQLFLEWNWIVVRFTEKQVVQAPLSCCKFIALAIAEVTGDRSFLEPLKTEPDLLSVKPWTTREARAMAKSNYRLTYLPEFGADSVGDLVSKF
ncbi:hypothetical protein K4039_22875 [Lyngbya sp. CCAP 1446/10]|uniref:hypothetical protein n=1 Tax=Lyngbya sp. CCAP 1446/10 TaxID=439293 RepID=UPI002238D394|nr:hypothetical protein [Lyngbya sp. CCAP 1446/10]MCW6052838.1 hypothetical protein [Lyngbya sp. CCAP 1446/10]